MNPPPKGIRLWSTTFRNFSAVQHRSRSSRREWEQSQQYWDGADAYRELSEVGLIGLVSLVSKSERSRHSGEAGALRSIDRLRRDRALRSIISEVQQFLSIGSVVALNAQLRRIQTECDRMSKQLVSWQRDTAKLTPKLARLLETIAQDLQYAASSAASATKEVWEHKHGVQERLLRRGTRTHPSQKQQHLTRTVVRIGCILRMYLPSVTRVTIARLVILILRCAEIGVVADELIVEANHNRALTVDAVEQKLAKSPAFAQLSKDGQR